MRVARPMGLLGMHGACCSASGTVALLKFGRSDSRHFCVFTANGKVDSHRGHRCV